MHPQRSGKVARGLLALPLLVLSCASAPYQQMSDARQAIEAAQPVVSGKTDERGQVERARALLLQAEQHLQAGEYRAARTMAEDAKRLAIEARESVEGASD